ncbi:MAG: prepilin-type N-terminal cleavage/methylation domain-containing protein [Candidatus Omnitrophota bacterium]|nr:prepilin-type N-terminal cleavage/methylation domain-containing protein [Candidatus Omnitrophota bacterium]
MKKNKAMTLMEIVVVVIIVGILATLGVVSFRQTVVNAYEREAQANLVLIQQAEHTNFLETRQFVSCADAATTCNVALHLNLPARSYAYSVEATNDADPTLSTFVASATVGVATDACTLGAHDYTIDNDDVTATRGDQCAIIPEPPPEEPPA